MISGSHKHLEGTSLGSTSSNFRLNTASDSNPTTSIPFNVQLSMTSLILTPKLFSNAARFARPPLTAFILPVGEFCLMCRVWALNPSPATIWENYNVLTSCSGCQSVKSAFGPRSPFRAEGGAGVEVKELMHMSTNRLFTFLVIFLPVLIPISRILVEETNIVQKQMCVVQEEGRWTGTSLLWTTGKSSGLSYPVGFQSSIDSWV